MKYIRLWNSWLQENIHRFSHKPTLKTIYPHCTVYTFKGINDQIELLIKFNDYIETMISFNDTNGKNYDHVVLGCESVLKGNETLIQEVFEPTIKYADKMFRYENKLYLLELKGMTEAYISNHNRYEDKADMKLSIYHVIL